MHEDFGRARTPTAGGRAARVSGCRGRLPLAVALAAIVGLVSTLIMGGRAYADGGGGGGSHGFGNSTQTVWTAILYQSGFDNGSQYIVGAWNKYDAAAMICGKSMTEIQGFDLVVRGKLSTNGGKFQELAEALAECWPSWNDESLQQSLGDEFGSTIWNKMIGLDPTVSNPNKLTGWQIDYWSNNCTTNIYAASVAPSLVTQATADMNTILGGGSLGGNSSGEMPSTLTFTMDDWVGKANPTYQYKSGDTAEPLNATFTVDMTMVNNTLGQYASDNPYITYLWWRNGSVLSNYGWTLNVYMSPDGLATVDNGYLRYTIKVICQFEYNTNTLGSVVNGTNNVAINYAGRPTVNLNVQSDSFQLNQRNCYVKYVNLNEPSGGGGDGGNDWPDPPSDPEPPEPPTVPDPPENPEPDPPDPPVAPTPPSPEPPTNVIIPTGTTPADYTPWLRAILEQLQTLTDELASHCVHLQEEMQISVNELQDTLIYQFNSLENHIWDLFNGLEDYMHDLAVWLAEQLDYNVNVDPYDDTSVLFWLRQIYSRLGNLPKSPTNIMDPDPTEPFDFWAWLMNLIADTVGGIIGDLVGDVAGLLDLFKDKFPFSIPWDIAALLALLDGTRATPVFDVKLVAVQGWWSETTFRIDLTPFNSVASACRTMVNIVWVMCLVMKTDWMLAIMGESTSFGERFARKVARTS